MSRYRLLPTPAQEAVLRSHCAHARYIWNLSVEQHAHWHPGRKAAPDYLEQCRQLTSARAEHDWLRASSQTVQQQALRNFAQAMAAFFDPHNPTRRPTWRKSGRDEGFRIVGRRGRQFDVRRLSRKTGEVWVSKAGWVRFRWSRAVPTGVKSYRVTMDRAGRWRMVRLKRKLARAKRGSNRRARIKLAVARLKARETDRRKDWTEKTSTGLARRFDLIRIEDLNVKAMTRSARGTTAEPGRSVRQKAGLNRGILASGWGLLARRLQDKAPGRVEKVSPAFTSQCCSACGHIAAESRKSQALFACVACSFACNADVNAARNIAAGHAVTARGGDGAARPVNREPQLLLLPA
jgi:transposase